MRRSAAAAVLLIASMLLPARSARSEERVELSTQPGVTLPILYDSATNPTASAILFVGGDGKLSEDELTFMLRVRGRFAAAGISVALPGTPSDHPGGFGPYFRTWIAHTDDVAAIVDFLKSKAQVPVWTIGNSNGTISAANAAATLGPLAIAGVILTSSVWLDALRLVPVETITVPVLVLQDASDTCPVSKPPLSAQNMARFKAASAKQFTVVAGPAGPGTRCGMNSAHDFYGVDDQTTSLMIDWIETNDRARMPH